jgi:polyhydroxyalkanoate synthesis regulator phasin
LKTLKVSTTTSNGLQTVDVYGKATMAAAKEQLEYILDSLVENGVLAEVSE